MMQLSLVQLRSGINSITSLVLWRYKGAGIPSQAVASESSRLLSVDQMVCELEYLIL